MKAQTLLAVLKEQADRVLDHIQQSTPPPPTQARKTEEPQAKPSRRKLRQQALTPAISQ